MKEIDAYVGRYTTKVKKPINYWLPTSLMIDILYYVYHAIENKNEELFDKYIAVLKDMLKHSRSGQIEFETRALTNKAEIREKILAAMNI